MGSAAEGSVPEGLLGGSMGLVMRLMVDYVQIGLDCYWCIVIFGSENGPWYGEVRTLLYFNPVLISALVSSCFHWYQSLFLFCFQAQ